jgi:hypothetical protein
MSRFLKKFLRENEGIFSRKTKPAIYLGAYGKHPGWDDHIDDIGLETESLLLAKQVLYVDGIGGQIDSGEWDKLHENQRLPEFKHVILWKRGNAFLLGRIWSSRDGKNRSKYPMVACTHCVSVPLPWGLTNVLPALEEVERLCKGTSSPEEVREIIRRTLATFRRSLASASDSQSDGKEVALIGQLGLADQQEKLLRIAYHVCTHLGRCAAHPNRDPASEVASGQVRLPAATGLVWQTLLFWTQFLESQFGTGVPILLALPVERPWLDATTGEPTSRDFYSLRVTPDVLAIASEVPYDIDDEFRKAHQSTVEALMAAECLIRAS